eukprot:4306379-Pyramimonas_sp.AAC.1
MRGTPEGDGAKPIERAILRARSGSPSAGMGSPGGGITAQPHGHVHAMLGIEPEPTTVPPMPGQPSDAQTLVPQGNLPVPAEPMTVVIGNPMPEDEE